MTCSLQMSSKTTDEKEASSDMVLRWEDLLREMPREMPLSRDISLGNLLMPNLFSSFCQHDSVLSHLICPQSPVPTFLWRLPVLSIFMPPPILRKGGGIKQYCDHLCLSHDPHSKTVHCWPCRAKLPWYTSSKHHAGSQIYWSAWLYSHEVAETAMKPSLAPLQKHLFGGCTTIGG